MLIKLTDALSNNSISLNAKYVVAVFQATEGEAKDKTVVSFTNGSIVVSEPLHVVVSLIEGELSK